MTLRIRALSVTFGHVRAVRSVSLEARPGEIVAIFGENGSGKTAFLKAVAGLVPTSGGRIVYNGEDVTLLPAHERVARGIHYVSDRARVAPGMTVRENIDVGGYLRTAAERAAGRERVLALFPLLAAKERQVAGTLSGGERQMLVIGRALMAAPSLVLFDEPFLGLAAPVRERLVGVVGGEIRVRATVLMAEHDLGAALSLLDRYVIFHNGEIVHEGRRDEVPGEERLRETIKRIRRDGRRAGGKEGG